MSHFDVCNVWASTSGSQISANIVIWSLTSIQNNSYRTLNLGWSPKLWWAGMADIVETPLHRSVYSQQSPTSVEEGTFSGFFSHQMCLHPSMSARYTFKKMDGQHQVSPHNEPTRRLNRKCLITARKLTRRNIDRKFSADVSNWLFVLNGQIKRKRGPKSS